MTAFSSMPRDLGLQLRSWFANSRRGIDPVVAVRSGGQSRSVLTNVANEKIPVWMSEGT
jgi:hypothetical protein